ncbi:putative amine oxidase [copper-containing] [Aplysia californica]|uniref:Amine oxidase n=1 Tax=Aplysia californica TaxID=6500 RepID=A0ABM0ZY43_APLCA|nr:putative amine oxidase [copper-containing] [Aplysia californica]
MSEKHIVLPDESGSEEELHSFTNTYQLLGSPIAKNRRHKPIKKNQRTALVIGLTLSLLGNVTLLILLLLSGQNCWSTKLQSASCVSISPTSETTTQTSGHFSAASVSFSDKSSSQDSAGLQHDDVSSTTALPLSESDSTTMFTTAGTESSADAETQAKQKEFANINTPALSSCQTTHQNQELYDKRNYNNIFADLTPEEITSVYGYLKRQADLKIQTDQEGPHVYSIELQTPSKRAALVYMDETGRVPTREARVVLVRPDLDPPVVQELVVGPLPSPMYHRTNTRLRNSTVPYRFHPMYGLKGAYRELVNIVTRSPAMLRLLRESFGANIGDCGQRCLTFLPQRTSSAYSDTSLIVLSAYYSTEFTTIHPVPLMFVMKETALNSLRYRLLNVRYAGQQFKSVPELLNAYRKPGLRKIRRLFPQSSPGETSTLGSMNLRGRKFPPIAQEGPKEYEPQGKRYSIKNQHVQYLDWSFNLRISTSSGPQVWDVKWADQRVAYEISLQDVGVIYAGANPASFYAHLSDSAFGLGDQAYGLMPGVDCPDHATFLPQTIYSADESGAKTLKNALCLFEHNTGLPLRRHRSNDDANGKTYGGLVDRVLVFRSIIVEYNYDYIFDMVFHQNGAVELKTYATGYLMTQNYFPDEAPFGFKITDSIVGSIHHHIFNFKVDLDIQGQSNSYKTLDFQLNNQTWPWLVGTGGPSIQQLSFKQHLRRTEKEALLKYNFSQPKYYIVSNDEKVNKQGLQHAYRIDVKGFSKQILPDDSPVLNSRRWSAYQLMVTRRKEQEESSSSIFSMFDGADPVVDISRYWGDDEDITQQDLVLWVSVGMHHIPHTEDLPNTPTVGTEATVSLLPYNFFNECPSVGSRDSVRVDGKETGLQIQNYGLPATSKDSCLPFEYNYSSLIQDKSNLFP